MNGADGEASTPAPTPVLLGLGANVGDPVVQLARAVEMLRASVTVEAVSSVWVTEPVGHREQADFHNLVVRGTTRLAPLALLDAAQAVEAALGRVRTFRDGPRTMDVDLLACGALVIRHPRLEVPHPRMAERAFVLRPLAEVAPEWRHPRLGMTARELLNATGDLERAERWGALPTP
ncbi:MAG: 2-amino-4-hydroxy-6-hydroxymethyldihydropteridin epyrophosphokinae [Gemmatimonadetes bacterium]|nr:2-amino-4-hydroxy-6-hydroxymethyldihydropteridin epyrophosphokinae [Gemmatimonadota bacterium]